MTSTTTSNEPASPPGDSGFVRLRLDLAYDGTEFFGWASQPELRTVQQTIEAALKTVLRLKEPPRLTVAGRTDTGVHAIGQVAHVDLAKLPSNLGEITRRLNGVMPKDVALHRLSVAPEGFEARFGALGRRYAYRVADGPRNPVRRRDTVMWPRPLDVDAMNAAARGLLGEQDFAAYCKPRKGATTIRTLQELSASRDAYSTVVITTYADAFCHNQVRSMVGALLAVGDGRQAVGWPAEILAAKARNPLVNVAPALGLTLVAVDYPPDGQLAERTNLTRQRRV